MMPSDKKEVIVCCNILWSTLLALVCLQCVKAFADGERQFSKKLLLPPCDASSSSIGTMTLVNASHYPAQISSVRSSCSCLSLKSPMEIIPPGKSVQLEFTLSPNGKEGTIRQKAWIDIQYDTQKTSPEIAKIKPQDGDIFYLTGQRQIEIRVLAQSTLHLGLDNYSLDFSLPYPSATIKKQSTLLIGKNLNASITNVKIPQNTRFRFEITEEGRSLAVIPNLEDTLPNRNIIENWTLFTSDENIPALSLRLTCRVNCDFEITPEAIVKAGTYPMKGVLLLKSANARQTIKVQSVQWSDASVKGIIDIQPLPKGLCRISYSLDEMPNVNLALEIRTSSKMQPLVLIPVR